MKTIKPFYIIFILGLFAAAFGLYSLFKPVSFLLLSVTVLSILYFLVLSADRDNPAQQRHGIFFSVLFFFLVFTLSVKVMKDYQQPSPSGSYYSNVDHYAIENYGIFFNDDLVLYSDEKSKENGLWPADTGSFRIRKNERGNPLFVFDHFFTPVFSVDPNGDSTPRLLNPVIDQMMEAGFRIADSWDTLCWNKVETGKRADQPSFDMELIFRSVDENLLGEFYTAGSIFSDTIQVSGLELKRGLNLRNILIKSTDSVNPAKRQIALRWLERFSGIYLLTVKDSGKYRLNLFPGGDFFSSGKILSGEEIIAPVRERQVLFDTAQQFFTGLSGNVHPYRLRKCGGRELFLQNRDGYVLENGGVNYLPLSNAVAGTIEPGKTEIRFLKNNYNQLTDGIREGFLFHDDSKNNPYTRFNALLEYKTDLPGIPLGWKIYSLGASTHIPAGTADLFGLDSENRQITWLFSFTDFSKNPFDFLHAEIYLLILAAAMVLLLVFKPSRSLIYIEAPLLMVVYILFVVRLLLLWRVASFPPLDNIRPSEFSSVRLFDMQLFGKTLPLPFSLLVLLAALVIVYLYRVDFLRQKCIEAVEWMKATKLALFVYRKLPVLLRYLLILGAGLIVWRGLSQDFIKRILGIIYPVALYFYFAARVMRSEKYFNYNGNGNTKMNVVRELFGYWIRTPLFFMSALTLAFLAFTDKGFAVLFFFFLLVKNILLNFSFNPVDKRSRAALFFRPVNYWVYGLISLLIFMTFLANKETVAFLLDYKLLVIRVFTGIVVCAFFVLKKKGAKGYVLPVAILLLLSVVFIPRTSAYIKSKLDDTVRNVVYRASILFKPVENLLFDYRYNTSKEQKIIETAQNQWFINSYLDLEKTHFIETKKINFKPHFNKGVDYITQTRDVVLPRFVIAEFGGLTMLLLLILISTPLVLYFLGYKMASRDGGFIPSGCIGAMALIFLWILCLFVWLTATNRFAFFGQDFPFLSLSSRISTLLPLLLIFVVLTGSPQARVATFERPVAKIVPWFIFFSLVSFAIVYSGRSNLIPPGRFAIDFSKIENRMDSGVNGILERIQNNEETDSSDRLLPEDMAKGNDVFRNKVGELMKKLSADNGFKSLYDESTVYERSILDSLLENPALGFKLGSPVHLKFDDGVLQVKFNKYFHLELPAYEDQKVWKGDIVQELFRGPDTSTDPVWFEKGEGQVKIIDIPASYLSSGAGPLGLINLQAKRAGDYLLTYVYNAESKTLRLLNPGNYVSTLGTRDILFFTDPAGNYKGTWEVHADRQPYFACNFEINGKQRQVYPLGKSLFWIYPWSQTGRILYESRGDYKRNSSLTLDYRLTDLVNRFLQSGLRDYAVTLPGLNFSVIAADGDGKVRLMADFDGQREIIDPNDAAAIARKEREQYFIVNNEAERMQWGNINLLRMKQGPGSSVKPVVAAAIASQLNLGWENLELRPSAGLAADKESVRLDRYAGLSLGRRGWGVEASNNTPTNFTQYVQHSNNLYHSLLVFLGSYQKERYYNNGSYSLRNVLTEAPRDSLCSFPRIGLARNPQTWYLPPPADWPGTYGHAPEGHRMTWFGNNGSLLARGLTANFDLYCEHNNKWALTNQRENFSELPDTIMRKIIWSFPEESFFLQNERVAQEPVENFTKGLRNPTLGGSPYQLTPFKMMEFYGKLVSGNPHYAAKIDLPATDTSASWNYDPATWGSGEEFNGFLRQHVFAGMTAVLNAGTAVRLTGGSNRYKGYFLYAKTGTIDGGTKEDNSKRLALIISRDQLENTNGRGRFFIIYFTIENAFKSSASGTDKNWFWPYYRRIVDGIMESQSFKIYMQ